MFHINLSLISSIGFSRKNVTFARFERHAIPPDYPLTAVNIEITCRIEYTDIPEEPTLDDCYINYSAVDVDGTIYTPPCYSGGVYLVCEVEEEEEEEDDDTSE